MHMHGESYSLREIRRKRERAQRMANARWRADRERRTALATAELRDPLRVPVGRILQRIVVIDRESRVTEIVRRDTTSAREWARLKKLAMDAGMPVEEMDFTVFPLFPLTVERSGPANT